MLILSWDKVNIQVTGYLSHFGKSGRADIEIFLAAE